MRTLPKFSMLTAITAFAVVALDQITKILVRMYIPLYAEVPFIPYFMKLTHSQNAGASFGILKNNRWIFMVCSTVAIIAIIAFLIYEIRKKEPKRNSLFMVALSFVVGGGIGNMIDRIFVTNAAGEKVVTDMFEFAFVKFAIFNVADMFITFGAVMLCVYMIFYESKYEKLLKNAKNENNA